MAIAKRVLLFFAVNILVLITISVVMSVLGVGRYITPYGINYTQLAIFCLLWGFGGAFISLGLSRIMAKWMMGVKVIDPRATDGAERWLVDTVHQLARQAQLPAMPEVGIYNSPDPNAFATGPSKRRALVAVSSGLLQRMDRNQVTGVLAHEVTHVANGDMVTMTLIQGIVNAFVMFFARIIAFAVTANLREEMQFMARFIVTIVLEILLSFLGLIVVAYFSRIREFRADRGGARLAGRENMVAALQGLQSTLALAKETSGQHESIAALKISGKTGGLAALFATHPPLEVRIKRLQTMSL
jgi:heat shock protein HtpX